MPEIPAFFDLSPSFAGWCVGAGDVEPVADAYPFSEYGEEFGELGFEFWRLLDSLHARFGFTVAAYEKPILVVARPNGKGPQYTDKLETLQANLGLGFFLETWCRAKGIPCGTETIQAIKKCATGNQHAEKKDVAAAMERIGIELPKTLAAGRLDAGDAAAGWVLSVRAWNPWCDRWDKALRSRLV